MIAAREYGAGTEVLAIHGITSHGGSWANVAARLPGHRAIAADLRGRGRSHAMPGPFGLRRHAEDLGELLDARGGGPRVVAGHSMGAFVAVTLAALRPELVSGLVLVDGGWPLVLPPGMTPADTATLLGPAAARLALTFPTPEAYVAFWNDHPAIGPYRPSGWDEYARDDLVGEQPRLRASASTAAMIADGSELYGPDWYRSDLASLAVPVTVLRAPRGLLDAEPLYPAGALDASGFDVVEVDDVNHYTILFGESGAAAVADAITRHTQGARS